MTVKDVFELLLALGGVVGIVWAIYAGLGKIGTILSSALQGAIEAALRIDERHRTHERDINELRETVTLFRETVEKIHRRIDEVLLSIRK